MKDPNDKTALVILSAMINASEAKLKTLWNSGYNMQKDARTEEVYMQSLIAQRDFIESTGSDEFLKAELNRKHYTRE